MTDFINIKDNTALPEKFFDVNGVEIQEGQTVSFSSYIPQEETSTGVVYVHPDYGGLWVNQVPVALLWFQGLDYRKLKVEKKVKHKGKPTTTYTKSQ